MRGQIAISTCWSWWMTTHPEKFILKAGYAARRPYHDAADVFPVREATFQRKSQIAGTLPRAATLEGIVVYERP